MKKQSEVTIQAENRGYMHVMLEDVDGNQSDIMSFPVNGDGITLAGLKPKTEYKAFVLLSDEPTIEKCKLIDTDQ